MDVFYGKGYDSKETFLMEVPQAYLEDITNSKTSLKIKGNQDVTVLTTTSKTYELKFVYTTNNFYLLERQPLDNKSNVSLVAEHTLEVNEYMPKRSEIYNLLKSNSLNINKFDGATNMNCKIPIYQALRMMTFDDLLHNSDMNHTLLQSV